jgi:hypothetical protein
MHPKIACWTQSLAFKLKQLKSLFLINNETRHETPADNIHKTANIEIAN